MTPRLKLNRNFKGPSPVVSFGMNAGLQLRDPSRQGEHYFAFATARGSTPQVFTYDTDPDGLAALANLIRSDEVLAVVKGSKVQFQQASVVELSIGSDRLEHRLHIDEV